MQRVQVWSLVTELWSHMLHREAKKKKNNNTQCVHMCNYCHNHDREYFCHPLKFLLASFLSLPCPTLGPNQNRAAFLSQLFLHFLDFYKNGIIVVCLAFTLSDVDIHLFCGYNSSLFVCFYCCIIFHSFQFIHNLPVNIWMGFSLWLLCI